MNIDKSIRSDFPIDIVVSSDIGMMRLVGDTPMAAVIIHINYTNNNHETRFEFSQPDSNHESIIPSIIKTWNTMLEFI